MRPKCGGLTLSAPKTSMFSANHICAETPTSRVVQLGNKLKHASVSNSEWLEKNHWY